jgi:hypothetical protein
MCCFSGNVQSVTGTQLFARALDGGRQVLVYTMSLAADADLAMILPLPVPPAPAEDAVRFIDLHRYPSFFDDVAKAWPPPQMEAASLGAASQALSVAKTLKVHDVGDFEASFVPRLADFDRVDPRFRLPQQVWDQLPGYADFGFAVFKLRGGEKGRPKTIHPMAFDFPVRDHSSLFFPTVHVHDGVVHPEAPFAHMLYFQGDFLDREQADAHPGDGTGYATSPRLARETVDLTLAAGIVDGDAPFRCLRIHGMATNGDTFVTPRPDRGPAGGSVSTFFRHLKFW